MSYICEHSQDLHQELKAVNHEKAAVTAILTFNPKYLFSATRCVESFGLTWQIDAVVLLTVQRTIMGWRHNTGTVVGHRHLPDAAGSQKHSFPVLSESSQVQRLEEFKLKQEVTA